MLLNLKFKKKKDEFRLIQITKEQANYIRSHSDIRIAETGKFKAKGKRKKYYVEETPRVKSMLKECDKFIVLENYTG